MQCEFRVQANTKFLIFETETAADLLRRNVNESMHSLREQSMNGTEEKPLPNTMMFESERASDIEQSECDIRNILKHRFE